MNKDMKAGAIFALEPKGFSVLKGYVDDRMNDFRSDE